MSHLSKTRTNNLRQEYRLTRAEARKLDLLILWVGASRDENGYVEEEEFRPRYEYLFGEPPLFYTFGPIHRDHGLVRLKRGDLK